MTTNRKFTKKRICTASNFIDLIKFQLLNLSKLATFFWLNPKGPYQSLEKIKRKFLSWFTDSMKRALEIRKFHVAVAQPRQRNEQNSMIHVQICCFVDKNLLLFAVLLPSQSSLVLLSSKNSATMVTWRHTSLYYNKNTTRMGQARGRLWNEISIKLKWSTSLYLVKKWL